jgi:ribosomal-protein-alanine N-acetyltransferase
VTGRTVQTTETAETGGAGLGTGRAGLDIVVAPMGRRHVRSVARIEETVYDRPWASGLFLSELAHRDTRTYLIAKHHGRVVGYGGAMYVLPDAHITTIAVDPSIQRSGIATRLLLALCDDARERAATALTLEVRMSNQAAQGLYRRFGFVPAGARKAYYPGTSSSGDPEDALVMWAHDIDQADFAARLDAIRSAVAGTTTIAKTTTIESRP